MTTVRSKLTSQAVQAMMLVCLFAEDEPTDRAIIVKGILHDYGFHPDRIAKNADAIGELLAELPDEFQRTKGGGWTFLNACMDKHDHQWTGEHLMQERLICLGIAAGKAKWLMPRDLWDKLPGGMPYVSVN